MNTTPKANQLLLDIQQLVGDEEDADRALVRGILLETHTCLPGEVVSFDKDLQVADIRPTIRRLLLPEGKLIELPLCVKVPCFFPGGSLTFDVNQGDDAVLIFSERCLDAWWTAGGVQDPVDLRNHDLSDGLALLGFSSKPKVLDDILQGGSELRLRDGSNRVSVRNNGTVHIGTSASLSLLVPMVNGLVLGKGVDTLTGVPYSVLGSSSLTVMAKP